MAWDENLTALNKVLADLYPADQVRRVLAAAEVPLGFVSFQGTGLDVWYSALDEAQKRHKVERVIRVALDDYPDDARLARALDSELAPDSDPQPDEDTWRIDIEDDHLERLIEGQSTLLPISFLERGMQAAASVGLLRVQGRRGLEYGTGFLIEGDLLVTNNHVIPSPEAATQAELVFNFEQTDTGGEMAGEAYDLDPDTYFATSVRTRHDWTVVGVKGSPTTAFGHVELGTTDRAEDDPLRWVNIIQHPLGGPKAIALYHNVVTHVDDATILYMTDTQPGSSGSPVFDSEWRVVGLHRGFRDVKDPGKWRSRAYRNWGTNIRKVTSREL